LADWRLSRGRLGHQERRSKLWAPVPCAIAFNRWAAAGTFDTAFYVVQVVELVAGAINFVLMGLNVRDGLRMAGRLRPAKRASSTAI
jgi:hypothetical protein